MYSKFFLVFLIKSGQLQGISFPNRIQLLLLGEVLRRRVFDHQSPFISSVVEFFCWKMHIKTELELLLPRFSTESCFKHAKTTVFWCCGLNLKVLCFKTWTLFDLFLFVIWNKIQLKEPLKQKEGASLDIFLVLHVKYPKFGDQNQTMDLTSHG